MVDFNRSFVPLPMFHGENYDFWSIKMKTYFRSQNLWDNVEEGLSIPEDTSTLSDVQNKTLEENKQKDSQALFALQQSLADNIFPCIMGATTAKEAWCSLQEEFQGGKKVVKFNTMSHVPDDEPSDMMEVEIPLSLPLDMIETQPHERPDISQYTRQQNTDNKRVSLYLGESSGVKSRKMRSNASTVWEHFVKFKDASGKDRARCKHCNNDYDADSRAGTSRLSNHLKSKSCQRMRNGGGSGDNSAGSLSDTIVIKEKSVMDQPLNHLDVARTIIKHGDASLIDSSNKDYIVELYEDEKKKLHNYFKKRSCCLCVTFCPTDFIGDYNDGCLMVWFIDDDWKLKNKILKHFDPDEDSAVEDIKNVLLEWGIENSLSSMVIQCSDPSLDDCNSYKGDDWFSNQHSLLLGSKLLCSEDFLYDFVCLLSNHLYESLTRLVNNISETSSGNENSWNAPMDKELEELRSRAEYSNMMGVLKNVLGLKEARFESVNIDPHFKLLTKEEWDVLRVIYECFEEWHFLQQCCNKYKTANTCFPLLCSLHKCFKEFRKCHVNDSCDELIDLIERAWCEYNLVLAVASVLDPRFKMDIVENWYKEIFGDEWKKEFVNFNNSFIDIYRRYGGEVNNFKSCTPGSEETNSSISYKMLDLLGEPCKSSYEPNHVQLLKSDLDRYLEEDKFPPFEDFDILEWWRVHARCFPTLARMARDFLSIQMEAPPFLVSYDDQIWTEELDIRVAYRYTKNWLAT